MQHIAALGVLRYTAQNNASVTFPGDVNTSMSSRQVKTSDGRSIKWVEHELTVSGWIFASDLPSATGTADQAFANVRQILSQSGGRLDITGKGFGDYHINSAGTIYRDINWGPHPEVINWEPFGNICCRFTWKVKFTLPWKDGINLLGGVCDFTWDTTYEYDSAGFCDRVITVDVEIAGWRAVPGNILTSPGIENYLFNLVKCDCPRSFHRKGHTIKVNKSKTIATITFTDEQDRGMTYPPGIADMDIVHDMQSLNDKGTLSKWVWTFSGTAIADARYATSYAYEALLAAHQHRWLYMLKNAVTSNGVIVPMPMQFKVTEIVKQRRTSLVATWALNVTAPGGNGAFTPPNILSLSGMWQTFPFSPDEYRAVANSPQGPNNTGGFTRMMSDNGQNAIIDISTPPPSYPNPGQVTGNASLKRPPNQQSLVMAPFGLYLEFKASVKCKTSGNRWINYPLLSKGNREAVEAVAGRLGGDQFLQELENYDEFVLTGFIVRIGIPTDGVPQLSQIAGIPVYEPATKPRSVTTYIVYNSFGYVVWRTDFTIWYMTDRKKAGNPVQAVDGMQNDKPNQGNNAAKVGDKELVGGAIGGIVGGIFGVVLRPVNEW